MTSSKLPDILICYSTICRDIIHCLASLAYDVLMPESRSGEMKRILEKSGVNSFAKHSDGWPVLNKRKSQILHPSSIY